MKVTVVLATCDGEKYLLEQLESLSAQERLPDELIVCDDLSKDATLNIVRNYEINAPFRVTIVESSERRGVSENFDRGLSIAQGELIFFCDQDDVWHASKIRKVIDIFESNKSVDLIINDMVIVNHALIGHGVTMASQVSRSGIHGFAGGVAGCATAVRAEILPLLRPLANPVAQYDVWMHRLVSFWGGRYVLNEVLQKHRRHSNNLSHGLSSFERQVSRLRILWFGFRQNPLAGVAARLRQLSWMEKHLMSLEMLSSSNQQKKELALSEVNLALMQINARKRVLQAHVLWRIFLMPRAFLSGAYSSGRGKYFAAIKDLTCMKVYRD